MTTTQIVTLVIAICGVLHGPLAVSIAKRIATRKGTK